MSFRNKGNDLHALSVLTLDGPMALGKSPMKRLSVTSLDCPPTPERTPPPQDPRQRPARGLRPQHSLVVTLGGFSRTPPACMTPSPSPGGRLGRRRRTSAQWPPQPVALNSPRAQLSPEYSSPLNPFSPCPDAGSSPYGSFGHSFLDDSPTCFEEQEGGALRLTEDFDSMVQIGAGESGEVFKARSALTSMSYAVKVKKLRQRGTRERKNQLQEVYALSAGYHPHIIRFHHAWQDDRAIYIVTELCAGGSVSQEMWDGDVALRAWSEADLGLLLHHIGDALSFLHANNMAHLDLKMDNVFIATDAAGRRSYKLGDFGLVRLITGDHAYLFEGLNDSEGDSRYMDGYLLNHSDRLREADVFSLGASIYELARRRPLPTCGEEFSALRAGTIDMAELEPAFGAAFLTLLRQMLHPDPDQRPAAFDVLRFAAARSADSSEMDLLRKEVDLLRNELQALKKVKWVEKEMAARRRRSSCDRCISEYLES